MFYFDCYFIFLQGGKLYFTECVWSTGILILSVK